MSSAVSISENRIVTGCLPGFDQPVALITIVLQKPAVQARPWLELDQLLAAALPGFSPQLAGSSQSWQALGQWFLNVSAALQQAAFYPCLQSGKLLLLSDAGMEPCHIQLQIPVLGPQHSALNQCLHKLVLLCAAALECNQQAVNTWVASSLVLLRQQFPAGLSGASFLQAAATRHIPWQHIINNLYQYGWGKNSRLMDGSFTDATSNIATRLARHKFSASYFLGSTGIPVPKHVLVQSLQQAETAAAEFGYPVVIKPLDQDGGIGVSAGIMNIAVLRSAYSKAIQHSHKILLEQHVPGKDYRLYVINNEVLHVYNRIPANITGDGISTITALVARANEDPRRQASAGRLKQMVLDADALELLTEQGMQVHAVPAAGHNIILRRTANINTGGDSIKLELASIHPDNIALALRAVRLLRLDIAGVDLLIPDIAVSWFRSGAFICEVNAQPTIPLVVSDDILVRQIKGTGRIPVLTIVENRERVAWLDDLLAELAKRHICTGLVASDGVFINQQKIAMPLSDVPRQTNILLRDTRVELVIVMISSEVALGFGAHCDRMDLLLLSGISGMEGSLPQLAATLAARADTVWINSDSPLWKNTGIQALAGRKQAESGLFKSLLTFVAARL